MSIGHTAAGMPPDDSDHNVDFVPQEDIEKALRIVARHLYKLPPHLAELTAARLYRMGKELTSGIGEEPAATLSPVYDNPEGYDAMIVLRHSRFDTLCEHHLVPVFGYAYVGYVPNHKVVGISKLVRLVRCVASRPQLQERMTVQIADVLQRTLQPVGCGVILIGRHGCISSRGVLDARAEFVTSKLHGCMMDKMKARNEFLTLAGLQNVQI